MECVLACMMPGNIHDSIINRFESVKDDGMWDDVDRTMRRQLVCKTQCRALV